MLCACLGTDGINEHIGALIEKASEKLSVEEAMTRLLTDAEAKQLYKFIHSAMQIQEMVEMAETSELDEMLSYINTHGLPDLFFVRILKYEK